MPQPTQHSLLCILLLWTTVISIIQVVLTVLFFTTGRNNPFQNSSAVEPERLIQPPQPSTLSPSSTDVLRLGKGKMLTFTATGVKEITGDSKIKWLEKNRKAGVIVEEEGALKIQHDGSFFLNLQVSSCTDTKTSEHTVTLKYKQKVLLEGRINTKTNTTGVLSKVEEMPAGEELEVIIDPTINKECINMSESATHLDIIFMDRNYV